MEFLGEAGNLNLLRFYAASHSVLKEHGMTLNSVIVYSVETSAEKKGKRSRSVDKAISQKSKASFEPIAVIH